MTEKYNKPQAGFNVVPESADFSMPPFSLLVIFNLRRPYYMFVKSTDRSTCQSEWVNLL